MLLDATTTTPTPAVPRPGALRALTESLYRIRAIAAHNTIIRRRDPGQAISYVALPMVLMLVLKPLYVRAVQGGSTQVVTGLLVMFSVFAIAIAGSSITVERYWKTWFRVRATRATVIELLIGKVLPIFVIMVVQQAILIGYGILVIGMPVPRSFGYVAVAVLVWAFALLGIGTALATIVRSVAELGVITDVGAMVLSSLGGALVPLSIMPGWARFAAHFSPGYWALGLLRAAINGDGAGMLGPMGVLLGLGVVAGAFAVRRLARGWGRSKLL